MDRLNFLNHYNRPDQHEDQLTRALLVCARLVPAVRGALAQLVRDDQIVAGVATDEQIGDSTEFLAQGVAGQGGQIVHVLAQVPCVEVGGGPIVAVGLSDARVNRSAASARDGGARHDGLIAHASAGVLVLENKLYAGAVASKEFQPNCPALDRDRVSAHGVSLEWAAVIERLARLLQERAVHDTQASLVQDFLDYVSELHPHLNPYATFALCGVHMTRLHRRCRLLREDVARVAGWNVSTDHAIPLPNRSTALAFIRPAALENGAFAGVWLTVWPADLVSQARAFYQPNQGAVRSEFLGLEKLGWEMDINFHVSFRGTHGPWARGALTAPIVATYFDYWTAHAAALIARHWRDPIAGFQPLASQLEADGILTAAEAQQFLLEFANRSFVDICPGFEVSYRFTAQECHDAEAVGPTELARRVLAKLQEVLAVVP